MRVAGSTLSVQVRRTDTGRYLSSSGEWVSQPVNAMTATDTGIASAGQIGLARGSYGQDKLHFDSLRVRQVQPETRELLQAERFDADTPGTLPDGWSTWSNRNDAAIQVGVVRRPHLTHPTGAQHPLEPILAQRIARADPGLDHASILLPGLSACRPSHPAPP